MTSESAMEAAPIERTSVLAALRERLQSAAKMFSEGKNSHDVNGTMWSIIGEGSRRGFQMTFPKSITSAGALEALLGNEAYMAQEHFRGVTDKAGPEFKKAQSDAPKAITKEMAVRAANFVYPDTWTREGGDYVMDGHTAWPQVEHFIKTFMNFASVAEVTRRQLGMEALPATAPAEAVPKIKGVLDDAQEKENAKAAEENREPNELYGTTVFKRLEDFMLRGDGKPLAQEKDIELVDMMLRLANAGWAGGQLAVAKITNDPGRLTRDTFDTPEGRTHAMYEQFKKEYDEETAFWLVAYENAKDYANLL